MCIRDRCYPVQSGRKEVSKRGMKNQNSYWLGTTACAAANAEASSCVDFGSSCILILILADPFPSKPAS